MHSCSSTVISIDTHHKKIFSIRFYQYWSWVDPINIDDSAVFICELWIRIFGATYNKYITIAWICRLRQPVNRSIATIYQRGHLEEMFNISIRRPNRKGECG